VAVSVSLTEIFNKPRSLTFYHLTQALVSFKKYMLPPLLYFQDKHLPFSPSPLRLKFFRLFVILSLTQLYRYTPEIFLFSTATFKYIRLTLHLRGDDHVALLHMAGLENSECIWKIQRKPEVVVSVSLTEIFNKPHSLTIFVQFVKSQQHRHLFHSKNIFPLLFLTSR
jgi:hypothetical protein